MSDEFEHESEFEPDDDTSPDREDDDDNWDDTFDGWSGPDIVYCRICGEAEGLEHDAKKHERYQRAAEALGPQLKFYKCSVDGGPLVLDGYCPPDEYVSDEYVLALCPECWEQYTVLYTQETPTIIAIYPGIGGIFDGAWSDNQPVDDSLFEPPL